MIKKVIFFVRSLVQKLHIKGQIYQKVSTERVRSALGTQKYHLNQGKAFMKKFFNFSKNQVNPPLASRSDMSLAWEDAKVQYQNTLRVARLAFKDNQQAQNLLQLSEKKRRRGIDGWLQHAQIFYATLLTNSKLLEELSKFGFTEKKLRLELDSIQERALAVLHISKTTGTETVRKDIKSRKRRSVL